MNWKSDTQNQIFQEPVEMRVIPWNIYASTTKEYGQKKKLMSTDPNPWPFSTR